MGLTACKMYTSVLTKIASDVGELRSEVNYTLHLHSSCGFLEASFESEFLKYLRVRARTRKIRG